MRSNYEKTRDEMQAEFLKYDHAKIAERFCLKTEGDLLCFDLLGLPARVSVKTGQVECFDVSLQQFRPADYDESMTVYDILCWSKADAVPAGEFINMNSLSLLTGAASAPSPKGFYSRLAREFDNRPQELCSALERTGGTILSGPGYPSVAVSGLKAAPSGDVTALFDVFCGLRLIFRFWNSDEDFDAQIQLLWDRNVLQYMHYETVWYAGGVLIGRLRQAFSQDAADRSDR